MTKPRKYQRAGVRRLRRLGGLAILADEPGLGKTLQVLLYIKKHLKNKGPVLVICPATARWTWEEQAVQHVGMRVVMLEGKTPDPMIVRQMKDRESVIYVISYNVLTKWVTHLQELKPTLIVPDESQRLKNIGAQWTRAAMKLKAKRMIFTGGTGGVEKSPIDLWPTLCMMRRAHWPPWWRSVCTPTWSNYYRFLRKFAVVLENKWGGEQIVGTRNMKRLHKFLNKYVLIRRRTDDVLKLPPKKRYRVQLALIDKAQKQYDKAESAARETVRLARMDFRKSSPEMTVKAAAAELLRTTGLLKREAVKAWIDDWLKSHKGKLLVFGWHKEMVAGLQKQFGDLISVRVDGGVTGRKRQAAIDRFNQPNECRLMFGNLKAAGEAWSCRSTSTVCFAEMFPNPAVHNQAEGRVHGLGRGLKGRSPKYYYLVAKGTAEERLLSKLRREQKVIDHAIDGGKSGGGIDLFEVIVGNKK